MTDFPPAPVPGPRGSRGRGVRATLGVARAPGATLLLAALALLAGCGRTEPERVVLVTIDTLRADHVGAYGDPDARTPTLDGLAEQGVLFETALSPVPLTLPTHASLLTALDPPRHGVRHNSVFSLDPGIPTLAERMQASGRATAAFVGALVLHHRFGLDRGFDVYDDRMGERRSSRVSGFAERRADAVVDAVLDWLETAPERFFLWVHFYDPHADYDPPMAYAVGFASRPYDGEIAFADAELGRMLAAIDARFDPDGTWVTVTSDHGESLGEHGEPTHSFTLYDATQKVPLVMRGPGLPAGLRVAAPARLIDVAPTLLAGIGAPPLPDVDGRDLAPLVAGRETEPRVAYMETLATKLELGWAPLFALRDDRHKYIRAPRPELYDLPRDPGELENLAPSAPQATARWEATLARELEGERPLVPSVALSEADRNQLESLGYLVPDAAAVEAAARAPTGPDPKDEIWLLDVLLRAARHIGRDRGAEALAVLAEAGDRGGAQVAGLRAQAALVAGDAVAAEAHAREALALAPDRSDTRLMLGEALLAQRRFDAAAEVLLRAREDAPESSRAIVGLARVAEARGEREEAIGLLRLALRPEAGRDAVPDAGWRLAALLLEAGQRDEADALLAEVPASELGEPHAVVRVALAEDAAGLLDRALARVEAARERHGAEVALHSLAGTLLEKAERLEDSQAAREQALALAPDAPGPQNDLAWVLALRDREHDRALSLVQSARAAAPGSATLADTAAYVRLRRGEPREALRVLEEVRPGASGEERRWLELRRAAALTALGRQAEARRALVEAVEGLQEPLPAWAAAAPSLARRLGVEPIRSAAAPPARPGSSGEDGPRASAAGGDGPPAGARGEPAAD